MSKPAEHSTSYENKLLRLSLLIGLLPLLLLTVALFYIDISIYFKMLVLSLTTAVVIFGAFEIRRLIVAQLRTATNLMESLTSGDFSLRAKMRGSNSALNEFNQLLNSLADSMAQQNLVNKERQILLHKIISHIDVAIVAVDHHQCISLMNPAAEQLFDVKFSRLDGAPVHMLGLATALPKDYREVVEFEIKQNRKKVYLHSDEYFEQGNKHRLIFITDIQDILRDEERSAWQRLLRVLSHEINNSLAPIASISESLHQASVAGSDVLAPSDFQEGLAVISERSLHLNDFIKRYQQLTKLPEPQKAMISLSQLIATSARLFDNIEVNAIDEHWQCYGDESQLEQVLVNLLKNACEANQSASSSGHIAIGAQLFDNKVQITITDNGNGISNMDNIFVPFYTTKNAGSGIGLVLSRQIIRNHGGELTLVNRDDKQGVIATISLPNC
ncbi:ATP-binding protein [Psychrobium sp. MM17-31]|uniref:sensor histidine kinase n=1 Tax=Psychrobium sp. MM17-31 TaxID=2917758 RepID=UPI001EF5B11E|nr:ATP-binding protein [Psychrobium sp. MM17-31]